MAIDTANPSASGPWPVGMNNRQAARALPVDQNGRMVALRNAVNVDSGQRRQTKPPPRLHQDPPPTGAHSGFACEEGVSSWTASASKQPHDDDSVTDLGGTVREPCGMGLRQRPCVPVGWPGEQAHHGRQPMRLGVSWCRPRPW